MRWVLVGLAVALAACTSGSDGAAGDAVDVDPSNAVALVPFSDDLGPGWSGIEAEEYVGEVVLFDPAREPDAVDCGITDAMVVHDALIGEYGFGQSPDDALVLVSRGTADQNRQAFDVMLALSRCEAQGAVAVIEREPPALAIEAEVARFAVDDEFDQHTENILVLTDGFFYFLSVSDVTDQGAGPTDFDALVVELFDRFVAES